ncbi:Aste57867_336 [Aphanomyces stellatus]|uniref:Aste57867_336 protein n=1 Tax=Aphanomyces stellatus TaxID=120398 RepID=A0A485K6H8_9STRA|nr:hypothetical protein As57867_000336 [Aphanomyces stellatus]VFT77562.1 Aste57867_336 [Aphanomyces stellatus]
MHKTPLHMQCQYAYKACTNPRTQKKDGEVHKLCALHRDKANSVQKIYAAKRRARMREQRKQRVIQSKLLGDDSSSTGLVASVQMTPSLEPIPYKATVAPTIDTMDILGLDVFLSEPLISPIRCPSESHAFSTEEYDILCKLLLDDSTRGFAAYL